MKNARQSAGRCGRREIELAQRFYRTAAPVSTDPLSRLLDRLDGVKETGPGRWIARCPAHDDRRPSLCIRELPDGTILLKCWPGCSAADIVAAVGLEMRDLFPPTDRHHRPRERRPWNALDVLRCVTREVGVASLAAADMAAGKMLSNEDYQRLNLAAERLAEARRLAEGEL